MVYRVFLIFSTLAWWAIVLYTSGPGPGGDLTRDLLWRWFGLEGAALDFANFVVRKAGHVFYYFVLSLLFGLSIRSWLPRVPNRVFLAAALLAIGTAVFDEWRQSHYETRTGQIQDLFFDGMGVLLGYLAFMRISRRSKPK